MISITPEQTSDYVPDAVRLSLLKRDEACRQAMAQAKAARLAGQKPAKKQKKSRSIRTGQMNPKFNKMAEPAPLSNEELKALGSHCFFNPARDVWTYQYRGVELTLTLTADGWLITHPTLAIRAMVARETPIIQMRDDLRALIIQAAPAWMLQAENYSPLAWIDGNAAEVA